MRSVVLQRGGTSMTVPHRCPRCAHAASGEGHTLAFTFGLRWTRFGEPDSTWTTECPASASYAIGVRIGRAAALVWRLVT